MDAELLRQYLEFYQDLGIKTLYRQTALPVEIPMDLTPLRQVEQAFPPANAIPVDLPPLAPTGDTLLKIIEAPRPTHSPWTLNSSASISSSTRIWASRRSITRQLSQLKFPWTLRLSARWSRLKVH